MLNKFDPPVSLSCPKVSQGDTNVSDPMITRQALEGRVFIHPWRMSLTKVRRDQFTPWTLHCRPAKSESSILISHNCVRYSTISTIYTSYHTLVTIWFDQQTKWWYLPIHASPGDLYREVPSAFSPATYCSVYHFVLHGQSRFVTENAEEHSQLF